MRRPMTGNRGAALERTCIRRYIARLRTSYNRQGISAAVGALSEVLAWLDGRAKRASERPGGLGRKRKHM